LHHLNIFQIESFLNKLFRTKYQTPEETLKIIKQSIRERQLRIRCQRKEMKRLCNKLDKKRTETATNYSNYIVKTFRPFIVNDQVIPLTGVAAEYSDSILRQICQLMKQNVPERNSCDLAERILCKIADKISFWMINFLDSSNFKKIENSCNDANFMKNCYPIEDYYPHDGPESIVNEQIETEIISESEGSKDSVAEETQIELTDLTEPKLSFLRQSQVIFDENECRELFERINQYQKDKAEKAAGGGGEKTGEFSAGKSRKTKRKENDNQNKIEKNDKKKKDADKSKEKNKKKPEANAAEQTKRVRLPGDSDPLGCYGNVNKKPQWEVEWIDRTQ
jgi:hypothetical protein